MQDDGPGFEEGVERDDGVSHVGIRNVRDRLKAISGGTLLVDSVIGKGTTVTMFLPKE